jgi:hypothetical protein
MNHVGIGFILKNCLFLGERNRPRKIYMFTFRHDTCLSRICDGKLDKGTVVMNHVGIGFILKKTAFFLEKGIGPEKYTPSVSDLEIILDNV